MYSLVLNKALYTMIRLCKHKGEVKVQLHTFSISELKGDGVIITTLRQIYLREDPVLILKEAG
jgi:hypothetical protein